MHRRRVSLVVLIGLGLAAAASVASTAGASSEDEALVTLTVGVIQDLDTPNVTAGRLASSHELWNLQYARLTDFAATDFAITPGLAESWEGSDDGLSYTYHLREGLTWSDGEPLTAADIAFTVNTSRDQAWINHSVTTADLDAVVVDDQSVTITSSVPDPKLPALDLYIVPEHIWDPLSADDVTSYDALDGVGSGPFTLTEWKSGQSWTMVANPSYWQGQPAFDQVVFRVFTNAEAMVAALEKGEIDAANGVPSSAFGRLGEADDVEAVVGTQGGFTELAMNGMAGGLGDGHPALLDLNVRHAVQHAIDKQALFERAVQGLGSPGVTMSVSPDPAWQPEIPQADQYTYDPAAANKLLDDGGYVDTNGDGVREMPDASRDLTFRYAERSQSESSAAIRELITAFLGAVGIATDVSVVDDTQLSQRIASGEYDMFVGCWFCRTTSGVVGVPPRERQFVDPDPMLAHFTTDQLTTNVESIGSNDANWASPEYDELYLQQRVELNRGRRVDVVREMLTLFYEESTYVVLYENADLQAYRTDKFSGWTRQPAETGPVIFTATSPSYFSLRPIGGGSGNDDVGGLGTVAVMTLIGGGVAVLVLALTLAMRVRSSRVDRG